MEADADVVSTVMAGRRFQVGIVRGKNDYLNGAAFATKSYRRIPSIRRWQVVFKASSECSDTRASLPYKRTDRAQTLYSLRLVERLILGCRQMLDSLFRRPIQCRDGLVTCVQIFDPTRPII